MKVRFPNEYAYDDIPNFDVKDFFLDKEFEHTVFGTWKGSYVQLIKKEYKLCLAKQVK
jgi:hypothetical protein